MKPPHLTQNSGQHTPRDLVIAVIVLLIASIYIDKWYLPSDLSPIKPIQNIELQSQTFPGPVTAVTYHPPQKQEQKEEKKEKPPKEKKKEITVYVTNTGSKYHTGGCRYLRKSKIPISLKSARNGYSPCSVCDPPQ